MTVVDEIRTVTHLGSVLSVLQPQVSSQVSGIAVFRHLLGLNAGRTSLLR